MFLYNMNDGGETGINTKIFSLIISLLSDLIFRARKKIIAQSKQKSSGLSGAFSISLIKSILKLLF